MAQLGSTGRLIGRSHDHRVFMVWKFRPIFATDMDADQKGQFHSHRARLCDIVPFIAKRRTNFIIALLSFVQWRPQFPSHLPSCVHLTRVRICLVKHFIRSCSSKCGCRCWRRRYYYILFAYAQHFHNVSSISASVQHSTHQQYFHLKSNTNIINKRRKPQYHLPMWYANTYA